jgi:hypothetical protein
MAWGDENEVMPCKVCKTPNLAGNLNEDETCDVCEQSELDTDDDDEFWTQMSIGDEKYKQSKEDND